MAILIDKKKRLLVQGITGREGQARTRLMREYGTKVVAGVTPGKGGLEVLGVPVFNTPREAVGSLGEIDISVLFVSPPPRKRSRSMSTARSAPSWPISEWTRRSSTAFL